MKKLFFWNDWYRVDRKVFLFFLLVTGSILVYLVYSMIMGVDNVIHWEVINNLERLRDEIFSFRIGNIKLDISLDNYIIFRYFQGSDLTIHPVYAYIYLVFLTVCINLVMAILPSLNKFWFYAGMGGFIGFMLLFTFGQIQLFNHTDKSALILILAFYLTAGYYFKEFKPDIPIFTRFLIFMAISLVIAVLFHLYAGVDRPFMYLANHGIYGPLIISVVFILSVAHEIIYGFLFLTTSASTDKSRHSLLHFILISLIYIFYVVITYLYYSNQIHWDMIYLNPFLILIVATLIGLWSFRKREDLYRELFPFYPVGALFYLGFAGITLITIAYAFSTGNDPMIEAFEDAILYSQIGFSIMFFIYVIANFGPMISRNFRVVKVVYQSRVFPFFVFRIGGVIAAGFLFFQAEFFPYYQVLAGYYNQVGDLYLVEGELDLAREYYEEASNYEYQNHRSNYAMGTIGRLQNNKLQEAYYFENSLLKRPTEYAYVNVSNVFLRNNQYFEGLFKIKEGQEKFPYSAQILNNLGYFYSRTDISDTAFYYFNLADNATRKQNIPEGNIYGLLAKSGLDLYFDSLKSNYEAQDLIVNTNKIAILNQLDRHAPALMELDQDSIRNDSEFAALYNSGLNALKSADTAYFLHLSELTIKSGNGFYQNRLDLLKAMHDYYIHRTGDAFKVLKNYATTTLNNLEYYRILGKLSLREGAPLLATEFLGKTNLTSNARDRLYYALALLESKRYDTAKEIFKGLITSGDPDIAALSEEYLSVLSFSDSTPPARKGDEFVYLLSRYHPQFQADSVKEQLMNLVKSPEIKGLMQIEYLNFLIHEKKFEKATLLLQNINPDLGNSPFRDEFLKIAYTIDLHRTEVPDIIQETGKLKMNDPIYLYDLLLDAQRQADRQDTTGLTLKFLRAGTWDPFFETGILKAVDYYHEIKRDDYLAYNLLIGATEINRYSVPLYKKMIDLALAMGLVEYALDGLEILQGILPAETYSPYRDEIMTRIREKRERMGF